MQKLHFIAVAGTGMGSAAGLFKEAGYEVRGSDEAVYPPMSHQLEKMEIDIMTPFGKKNLEWNPDLAVVGNVCRKDHSEVVDAINARIPLTSFPRLLGESILNERHAIVVAGTHGKTTTSTMLAFLLEESHKEPGWLIGGVPNNLKSGFSLGRGNIFILEGDEYDTAFFDKNPKFVRYRPKSAIVTGIEFDHADIYKDLDIIIEQFYRLSALIPPQNTILLSADNEICRKIARIRCGKLYGLEGDPDVDWCATDIENSKNGTIFRLKNRDKDFGIFKISLFGNHNLRNMTAALSMAIESGADPNDLRRACSRFSGVKKRQELIGKSHGVTILDDFGHHPKAIELTVEGFLNRGFKRIIAVFEPRSATSRRKIFQKPYATAFKSCDYVFIARPHDQTRIPESERFSSEKLREDLNKSGVVAESFIDLENLFKELLLVVSQGDLVLFFSSGSFAGLQNRLFKSLEKL